MTLHHYSTYEELVSYCQLCHEHGKKCRRVKVDIPTLARIRQVARINTQENRFLGIEFTKK